MVRHAVLSCRTLTSPGWERDRSLACLEVGSVGGRGGGGGTHEEGVRSAYIYAATTRLSAFYTPAIARPHTKHIFFSKVFVGAAEPR